MTDSGLDLQLKAASRRRFIKKCIMGGCGLVLGAYTVRDLLSEDRAEGRRVGFRSSRAESSWKWQHAADWYETKGSDIAPEFHCRLCPHGCILEEGDRGTCRVRVVKDGKFYSLAYGNPCAVHVDPIEKKPFFHFLPASRSFSLATAGCNLRCINCQNWEISQARPEDTDNYDLPPEKVVQSALAEGARSIAYTYTEPVIFYEYVYDTAQIAMERGLKNVLVTAGYINPQPLRKLCQVVQGANVDLKGFSDKTYKKVNRGTLAPVLRALEVMKEEGVWLEVGNLIIPGISDDQAEIRAMSKWIAKNLGVGTPFHLLRFHPDYKLRALPLTPTETMLRARDIAREEGLEFVYLGNVPEHSQQNTVCPSCGKIVIQREGYFIGKSFLQDGKCPCGRPIPGVWV